MLPNAQAASVVEEVVRFTSRVSLLVSGRDMQLEPLGKLTLVYSHLKVVDYGADGQAYGALEGSIEGPELHGKPQVTNLAPHRTDGAFAPTIRGLLTTPEGGTMFVTIDGISVERAEASGLVRIGLVALTFRSNEPSLKKWNEVFAVAEYKGETIGDSWGVRGTVYRCVPEIPQRTPST